MLQSNTQLYLTLSHRTIILLIKWGLQFQKTLMIEGSTAEADDFKSLVLSDLV